MPTIRDVVELLGDEVVAVKGDDTRALKAAVPISNANVGSLTFVRASFTSEQIRAFSIAGSCVICAKTFDASALDDSGATFILTENPRLAFMRAVSAFFAKPTLPAGIHPKAHVEPSASIHPTAAIGAFCYIGPNCVVGAHSVLFPSVTLYSDIRIGEHVTVNSGTVIGADGFGYERNEAGELEKFPHIGGVIIEDFVEIGSNTSIDRGTLGDTVIKKGARVDNQVHVAHNVSVGQHAAVIAQSMLGGSARIGDMAWLAPAAVILNQVKIGAGSTVGMGAVVIKDVPDGATVMGSPAVPADEFRAARSALKALTQR